nr:probable methyltransferase PMT26 [Tanacetum cinerariifolium]
MLVAFIALCLVGVWMMPSSVVPFQILDTTTHGNRNDIKIIENGIKVINGSSNEENYHTTTTKDTNSKQFEDNAGDLTEEAIKEVNSDAEKKENNKDKVEESENRSRSAEPTDAKEGHKQSEPELSSSYNWKQCNVSAGSDFIPCLDNLEAIKSLPTTMHYEHRERHCPQDAPTCLVPMPQGYQRPIQWPTSREKIWYNNVPHTKLAEFKGHQNWVKVSGEYLTFPGGGTQFKRGALNYLDFIQEIVPDIRWGNRSRVVLDVGCGVASFGGFLFDKDVLTMSFAPKDEHEAQSPPWHIEGGKLLLELNRLLRSGGFFVWSATPIYKKNPEDSYIWEAMKNLTNSMCWEVKSVSKDKVNRIGVAVYQKPTSNECYDTRVENEPSLCKQSDDPDAACNFMTPEDFNVDHQHWKHVVSNSYKRGLGINWSTVMNVMDMRAVYGGFAAAIKDAGVWVMNVVPIDSPDTLPIIYERGLFGIYHDWCESFSSYPRTYDLLHADHLFSKIKSKCNVMALVAEVDRLLRPEGRLIVRDNVESINEVEKALRSMHWNVRLTYSKDIEGLLCVQKTMWGPEELETLTYAIS